jgi:cytochrome c5
MTLQFSKLIGAACLFTGPALAQVPADTYFSLAVTENSRSHVGASKLFLDFQTAPFGAPNVTVGQVISAEAAAGSIVLDGAAGEWNSTLFTTFAGVAQNNHPLSSAVDGVATDITIGSAWDATHVYFVVQWIDAGHTPSTRFRKWLQGDQGDGQVGWNAQTNSGATAGAPNAAAVNATGHDFLDPEGEDQLFLMFPIVDGQGNYTPTGAGCAMYCHANLSSDFPGQNYTGNGVSRMGTNFVNDRADIWQWKSSRTNPSGHADDRWLDRAIGTAVGHRNDAGTPAYLENDMWLGAPNFMHQSGLGFLGDVLFMGQAVAYSGTAMAGDELPASVSQQPQSSRADIESAASFDPLTKTWTVELKRARDTGQVDDHSFNGAGVGFPTTAIPLPGNPVNGETIFTASCSGCHGLGGVGSPATSTWEFPRVQRATGSLIHRAVQTVGFMGGLGWLNRQQMEDIASYLQTQATFDPVYELTVNAVGATGTNLVTSEPAGINCPNNCSMSLTSTVTVTLTANPPPGYALARWIGPCVGAGFCSLVLGADTTITAEFAEVGPGSAYCLGNGEFVLCGCGNDNDSSLRGGLSGCANGSSSGGCSLYGSGSASISNADFVLRAEGLPPGMPGLFFQGPDAIGSGLGQVFGDGLRCVGGSVIRLQAAASNGSGLLSSNIDIAAKGAVSAGDVRRYQLWYRDPLGSPCGQGHNLSNGYELTWTP